MTRYLQQRCQRIEASIAALRPQLEAARRNLAFAEAQAVAGIEADEQSLTAAQSRAFELECELSLLLRLARAVQIESGNTER